MLLALDTWENLLEGLENEEVVLENERELKYYFFHRCLILMKKRKFDKPYSIFAEDSLNAREKYPKKCDLVLGKVVAIEFKHKKSINTNEVNEVKDDILKLESYIKEQKTWAGVFLMIDHTGHYEQRITPFIRSKVPSNSFEWQTKKLPNKKEKVHTLKVVLLPRALKVSLSRR